MARKTKSPDGGGGSGLASLAEKVLSTIGWLKTLGETLADRLEKAVEKQARRVFLFGLWAVLMGVGLSFFILGVLFLVIDLGGIPRGVVFTVGGLLVFLPSWVAWLLMRK